MIARAVAVSTLLIVAMGGSGSAPAMSMQAVPAAPDGSSRLVDPDEKAGGLVDGTSRASERAFSQSSLNDLNNQSLVAPYGPVASFGFGPPRR